jgi:CRP-like cAMP-binding protein
VPNNSLSEGALKVDTGSLGKIYIDGDIIIRQGDTGDCMYVIQEGEVEILLEDGENEVHLATRKEGDFFGEMALFDREVRSATVRARNNVRILTVDKKNLLSRIHKDPSMAFRLLETMSNRIRELMDDVNRLDELVTKNQ